MNTLIGIFSIAVIFFILSFLFDYIEKKEIKRRESKNKINKEVIEILNCDKIEKNDEK